MIMKSRLFFKKRSQIYFVLKLINLLFNFIFYHS